jgi:hypothetical protein
MNLAGLNWTPQPKLRIMVGDNKLKKRQKKFNDINSSNLSLDLGGPKIQKLFCKENSVYHLPQEIFKPLTCAPRKFELFCSPVFSLCFLLHISTTELSWACLVLCHTRP